MRIVENENITQDSQGVGGIKRQCSQYDIAWHFLKTYGMVQVISAFCDTNGSAFGKIALKQVRFY